MLAKGYDLRVGQWLRSDAVGAAAPFDGEFMRVIEGGAIAYLRDGQGGLWARERSELSLISPAKSKKQKNAG